MYEYLLKSMGYLQTFSPTEYTVKAVIRVPNHLRNSFCQSHSNIILERNSFVSLEQFEKWLDTKVKEQFNPIVNIPSIDQPDCPRYHIRSNNINQDEPQEVKCWFCSYDHKLGSCEQFLSKPLFEKKQFVEKEKLCWNCLAKGYILKYFPSQMDCRIPNCNKRHHTSLHESTQITTQKKQNIASNNLNNNNNLPNIWSNGLVVKVLDSQSSGPVLKTTRWLQGQLSLSSFRCR